MATRGVVVEERGDGATHTRYISEGERRSSKSVLPVGRFSRQIRLVLETVGGEILRFGGWLVFGLVFNDVCGFLGG